MKNGLAISGKLFRPFTIVCIAAAADRIFRYALGRETLEIPAGKVDPGEGLEECCRRELMEETDWAS